MRLIKIAASVANTGFAHHDVLNRFSFLEDLSS